MYLAQDVFCQKYCCGDGVRPYTSLADLESDLSSDACGTHRQKADYYVVALGKGSDVTNPMNITNKMPDYCHDAGKQCYHVAKGQTDVAAAIKGHISPDENPREGKSFHPPFHTANRLCYRGAYRTRKNPTDKWQCHVDTGLFGPGTTYSGCRRVRDGGYEMPRPRDDCC